MKNKPIVGINLGASFFALAVLDENGKSSIVSCGGHRITPSCIVGPKAEPGTLYVGDEAKQLISLECKEGFICQHFKRDMGSDKSYTSSNGDVTLTPAEASSKVLLKLVQEASKTLGEIDEVVITVPAQFSEKQRKATMEAGRLAGLTVNHIINEPTAAALAFATQQDVSGKILIYDLGGGTFDVTIAQVSGQNVDVLTSEGDPDLGGVDFDLKIAGMVDDAHKKQYGKTLKEALGINNEEDASRSEGWQDLLGAAEDAKKMLSKRAVSSIKYFGSPEGPIIIDITQEAFENEISGLIAKTEMAVEMALDNIEASPGDIDLVLMVGGSSRLPAVRKSLAAHFGEQKLSEAVNPDEAGAVGAAVYAGIKSGRSNINSIQQDEIQGFSVSEVSSFYTGILIVCHDQDTGANSTRVSNILAKETPIPCSVTVRFHTVTEDQRWMKCSVTQSTTYETDPDFVNIICEQNLGPLPAGLPAGQPIEVTFAYDTNNRLEVSFIDVNSGIEVKNAIGVDADVVAR